MHGTVTPGMKFWYTNNSLFTTLTPHSDSQSYLFSYVTSHVQYTKIIATCIKLATVLQGNDARVPCYSQLIKVSCWCLAPLRVKLFY